MAQFGTLRWGFDPLLDLKKGGDDLKKGGDDL